MMKKLVYILFLLFFLGSHARGQDPEALAGREIRSQTTYEYFVDEGLKEPVVEQVKYFDRSGRLLEEKEFNRKGDVRKWERFEYDSLGNVTAFITMDEKGALVERIEYRYREDLVTEKLYYDARDRLYKRKVYEYEQW